MSQSDIWAFGATLYEILSGKVPFGEEGGKSQIDNSSPILPIPNIPSDIQHLISDCLAIEPGNRPSAKTIKEAAITKQYPVRAHRKYFWLLGIGIIAAIIIAIVFLFKKSEPNKFSIEKLYQIALIDISSDDSTIVKRGVTLMDSLSNIRYIPAIYQMAYTYGWYIEDESLKRKKLLGIDIFEDEKDGLYLPKIDRYSNEALALLSKILELNDSTYAEINAQAAYRLACYYVNPNQIIRSNMIKGKMYLIQSKKWAVLSNDSVLLQKINQSLETFK